VRFHDGHYKIGSGYTFVFGSNLCGAHDGGAAKFAMDHCGARYGQEQGLQGDSYAIPTCFLPGGKPALTLFEIETGVNAFLTFAKYRDGLHFFVTPIATGIVGYTHDDIAPMFRKAIYLRHEHASNILLPPEWEHFFK
jgi:hypothetical protein